MNSLLRVLARLCLGLCLLLAFAKTSVAESGIDAWLRYAPLDAADADIASLASRLPGRILVLNGTAGNPVFTAGQELQKGLHGMFNRTVTVDFATDNCTTTLGTSASNSTLLVVGTVGAFRQLCSRSAGNSTTPKLVDDGFFWSFPSAGGSSNATAAASILGQNDRGALYGVFAYLSQLAQGNLTANTYISNPAAAIRWVNQWDNLDGSIERGYGGKSIFFSGGGVVSDLSRAAAYARLLASVGINAVVVNNVNADAALIHTPANLQGLGRIADAFRPYGVRVGVSLNFAAPQSVGGLRTYDPLDSGVVNFWDSVTAQLYTHVPDLAGYLVKGDSEGQPGPKTYNRTLAQGANLFARALKKHGGGDGVLLYRAFVYDQLQESNWHADRANAAVQYFGPLDGEFDDNVVVQVKYGPIDFQVREPASPLFSHLRKTNAAIELQVTQEYLGQQCHLVYLPPLWRTVFDFDMRVDSTASPVRDIFTGRRFNRPLGGAAGVVNVGTGETWLGSHLAQANLYAYGRLAWDPSATTQDGKDTSRAIAEDWARLTFGRSSAQVVQTVADLALASWPAYENYTGNLGMQTLTDILYTHFGPNPASQDGNGWGQWTRADKHGVGMDRTVANGTRFAGQYPPDVAARFESVATTPDDLLVWFHHVPYAQPMPSRPDTTVIQHIYDAHYAGAAAAQTFAARWAALASLGAIDAERHAAIATQLAFQAGHAIVWRDAICTFFSELSGIADTAGRVGKHPWRIEAEAMTLKGYTTTKVSPSIAASGGTAVVASGGRAGPASASATLSFPAGTYSLAVNYFDLAGGRSKWEVQVNNKTVGTWTGNAESIFGKATSTHLDGHSAMRVTFPGVIVAPGDTVTVLGTPDGSEQAPLDYVSFLPDGVVD